MSRQYHKLQIYPQIFLQIFDIMVLCRTIMSKNTAFWHYGPVQDHNVKNHRFLTLWSYTGPSWKICRKICEKICEKTCHFWKQGFRPSKKVMFFKKYECWVPYTHVLSRFWITTGLPEKIMISQQKKLKLIQFGVQNINKKCKKLIWAPFFLYNKSKM